MWVWPPIVPMNPIACPQSPSSNQGRLLLDRRAVPRDAAVAAPRVDMANLSVAVGIVTEVRLAFAFPPKPPQSNMANLSVAIGIVTEAVAVYKQARRTSQRSAQARIDVQRRAHTQTYVKEQGVHTHIHTQSPTHQGTTCTHGETLIQPYPRIHPYASDYSTRCLWCGPRLARMRFRGDIVHPSLILAVLSSLEKVHHTCVLHLQQDRWAFATRADDVASSGIQAFAAISVGDVFDGYSLSRYVMRCLCFSWRGIDRRPCVCFFCGVY